jgi:hypothetical protein
VVRIQYTPVSGLSEEKAIAYVKSPTMRYGEEIWLKYDFYQVAGSGNYRHTDNRKIVDYQGNHVRMTLNRTDAYDLRLSIVDWMNGSEQETFAGTTGIDLFDDTWYTLEVRMVTNSADNVRDGILEIYVDGVLSYTKTTGLGWITETGGASFFRDFLTGFQLTIPTGQPSYTDVRYLDNVSYTDGRL